MQFENLTENFTERDIPYDTLAGYGLSREMIDDLPENIMHRLLSGAFTPLLPLKVSGTDGENTVFARIALKADAFGNAKVFLRPEIQPSALNGYSGGEQQALSDGMVIITQPPRQLQGSMPGTPCFAQYDGETNQVLFTPASLVLANLQAVTEYLGISGSDIDKELLEAGEPQTFQWQTPDGSEQSITFGVDLHDKCGVRFTQGGLGEWRAQGKDFWRQYNFGLYGAWVADANGKNGKYILEKDYTPEMRAMQLSGSAERQEEAEPQVIDRGIRM